MTMHPFRRQNDISPEDSLDAWLNARTSGSNDNTLEPDGESLSGVAHEFHAWADSAQERDPAAMGPADDLWNRILEGRGRLHVDPARFERSEDMSTTIVASVGGYAPPQSNRTRRAQATSPLSRSGTWPNALAAALLLLTLGGGAYIGRNGGFGSGGGGGGEGRFGAQVVSPEASTDIVSATCDVEPLTVDEALGIVLNPLNRLADLGAANAKRADTLVEIPDSELPWLGAGQAVRPPNADEQDAMIATVNTYLACVRDGTSLQVWALESPQVVQKRVLSLFPVLRDEDQLRETIERYGNEPFAHFPVQTDSFMMYFSQGYGLMANDEDDGILILNDELVDPQIGYVGINVVIEDSGEVLARMPAQYGGAQEVTAGSDVRSPGELVVESYAGTDTWLVRGLLSSMG